MKEMKDALLRIIRAAMEAKRMDEALLKLGYRENPYFSIYGNLADAIYMLAAEKTDKFEDSVTFLVLNTQSISDERRAEILYAEMQKNKAPVITEHEEIRLMAMENGGYIFSDAVKPE